MKRDEEKVGQISNVFRILSLKPSAPRESRTSRERRRPAVSKLNKYKVLSPVSSKDSSLESGA